MKYFLFMLLSLTILTSPAQDSCFLRPTFEPLSISMNIDSIHLLLKNYNQTFIGCKAPDINCTGTKGETISTSKLKGKVTVLNFWFTHCKPCVNEFPSLNKLVDNYALKDVQFISFAMDAPNVLDTFITVHPLKYTLVPKATPQIADFKISSYPTNIVLDKNWRVLAIITGGEADKTQLTNYSKLKVYIDEALMH